MLISPTIEIANGWRIVSAIGWCFFSGIWISFALSLKGTNQKRSEQTIQFLFYIVSTIFFISNFIAEPSQVVGREAYGFVDNLYTYTTMGTVFNIYILVLFIAGLVIIHSQVKNSKKNRAENR